MGQTKAVCIITLDLSTLCMPLERVWQLWQRRDWRTLGVVTGSVLTIFTLELQTWVWNSLWLILIPDFQLSQLSRFLRVSTGRQWLDTARKIIWLRYQEVL